MLSHPVKFGNLKLDHNVILSPMAGITDIPFLKLCARGGCALMAGEMLSSQAIRYGSRKTLSMLRSPRDVKPVSWQLLGSDPDIMAESAKVMESAGADVIDVNAGCPVPKVTKTRSGAALLKDEARLAAILAEVVKAVRIPVTVKIRIGLRENDNLAPALAKLAEECGVAAVIVHARPVSKKHSGRPDWEGLKPVVQAVNIPVIGNGGVNAPQDAADFLRISECAGVSVGRAAIGDPGLFGRIRDFLETGECLPPPTPSEKLAILKQHAEWAVEFFGERTGLLRLRKLVPYYVAGFPHATAFRARANRLTTLHEWLDLIAGLSVSNL
jgi:tRNA-dihydrouridine synthase B